MPPYGYQPWIMSNAVPVPEKDAASKVQSWFAGAATVIGSYADAVERLRISKYPIPTAGDTKPPYAFYDPRGLSSGSIAPVMLIGAVAVAAFFLLKRR